MGLFNKPGNAMSTVKRKLGKAVVTDPAEIVKIDLLEEQLRVLKQIELNTRK
jgi:hypothetical protein